jgi:hypothetical protein
MVEIPKARRTPSLASEISVATACHEIRKALVYSEFSQDADRALYGALCEQGVEAIADVVDEQGKAMRSRTTILPEEWRDLITEGNFLSMSWDNGRFLCHQSNSGRLYFANVRILTATLDAWLNPAVSAGTAAIEGQCKSWLLAELEPLGGDRVNFNKKYWFSKAKDRFPKGLTERGFIRGWTKATEKYPELKSAGRKRKSVR